MSDDDLDTQWTPQARETYAQRAEELIETIRTHVAPTLDRTGRQKELGPYFESSGRLTTVANDFNNAEFNWCGSFPLPLEYDNEDGEDNDWDEGESAAPTGPVLSIIGRWDYRITDEAAVIGAGRSAYLRAWPDDTSEDAEVRVQEVTDAASELMHASGVAGLTDVEGLQPERDATWLVSHGGDGDAFDDDPFGILSED